MSINVTSKAPLIPMETLEELTPAIRAVAHPIRLRILDFLRHEGAPRTVRQIEGACGVQQAVVSQQLRILREQGVLSCERQGNHVFYRISMPSVCLILDCIRSRSRGEACGSPDASAAG